jgi:hypothetical protein
MLALQFATATANLASHNVFLFLATHGPIFIASSEMILLCHSNPVWIPVLSPLELLSHPSTRCLFITNGDFLEECDP